MSDPQAAAKRILADNGWFDEDAIAVARAYQEAIEALGNEYECPHGHRWWMVTLPLRCPDCNTSSFRRVSASTGRAHTHREAIEALEEIAAYRGKVAKPLEMAKIARRVLASAATPTKENNPKGTA